MSLFSLLEISRRSFRSLDGAMNTVGQNVANAETEGYARRRLTLQADAVASQGIHTRPPERTPTGAGVSIQDVERVRDALLAGASWEAQGALGSAQEEHRILSALEGLFPARGAGSLAALLDGFWSGWSDVADHPTDEGVRRALRGRTAALTTTLNRLDADLTRLREETQVTLTAGVDRVNRLLEEVAALNGTIETARSSGVADLASEDRRDALVQELSGLVPVRVQQEAKGGYTVTVQGMAVVQADHVLPLQVDRSGPTPQVTFGSTGVAFRERAEGEGQVGALLRTLNGALPNARAGLDELARGLVLEVHRLHTERYDAAGVRQPDGPAFFHYSGGPPEQGVTAASIRLSDAVQEDAGVIGAPGFFTGGGEEIALAIAGLRTASFADLGGATAESFATDLITEIGTGVQRAGSRAAAQTAVTDHLHALGRAVSAVSLDEEMTNLIQYQQAFGASAKVLDTVQQMMDTLLAL